MQGADALGNRRKVKTAGTTASGTLDALSTDAQGVVSDVLKTPVAAVEGVGDVGAPSEVKAAQEGMENASTGEAGMSLLIPEQSAVAAGQGLPVRVDGAVYKVVEIPQAKIDEISEYIDNNTTPSVKVKYKRIIKNLFMGQKFTNANTIAKNVAYEIGIGSKGIGEIIARQPVNAETLAMLEQLNEIVENAKFVASEPTMHTSRRGVERTDLFETETKFGSEDGLSKFRVNVGKDGNNLYFATHTKTGSEPPQPRADINSRLRGVAGSTLPASNIIPQSAENINTNLPQNAEFPDGTGAAEENRFYLHEVVDESGSIIYKEETPANASDGRTDISANSDTVAPDEVSTDSIRPNSENINRELPDGTGAAEVGFDPFSHLQNQKGEFHKTGEEPTIVEVPTTDERGRNISKGVQTALEAGVTPDAAVNEIQNSIITGKFSYLPITDSADYITQIALSVTDRRHGDMGF